MAFGKLGYYSVQHIEDVGGLSRLARRRSDTDGCYRCWIIKPAVYFLWLNWVITTI
jgi:hypothetical protein